MDLLSFRSGCETLSRVCEKENEAVESVSKKPAQSPVEAAPGPRPKMTRDQANLDFMSRVKVNRGS